MMVTKNSVNNNKKREKKNMKEHDKFVVSFFSSHDYSFIIQYIDAYVRKRRKIDDVKNKPIAL